MLVLGGLVAQLGELDLLRRADVGVALGYGLLQLLLRAGDLAAAAAHVDELLLVGVLRVVQLGLEVLELAALARGEEYQHVAHLDLLPARHEHGLHLARGAGLDLIGLLGRNCAGAADLRRDGA